MLEFLEHGFCVTVLNGSPSIASLQQVSAYDLQNSGTVCVELKAVFRKQHESFICNCTLVGKPVMLSWINKVGMV